MTSINNIMLSNTSSNQIGNLYLNMYKNAVNQTVNESVQNDTKENLKRDYYSNTPFHKFQTDYSLMYESYQVTNILRESWNNDLKAIAYLLERDEELCNEIFGGLVQKAKQGIQAGAQAVQQKLLQPLLQMILKKIPKNKLEELAQATQSGPQALQAFINKEGDPNVGKEIASTQANESLAGMVELIGLAANNNFNEVLTEGVSPARLGTFRSVLNAIGKEAKDPAVKGQVQQMLGYIKANYNAKGQFIGGGAAAPGGKAPAGGATPTPGGTPAGGTPAGGATGPLPAGGAAGPLPASAGTPPTPGGSPAGGATPTPGGATPTPGGAPAAGGGFISKALNWMKNNKALTAAGAIGLIGAIALATGGIGLPALSPALLGALKSAGVSGAVGAAGGAIKGAQGGGGLKGAAKGALKGGATGAAVGAAGSLIGQAAAGATGLAGPEQEADGSALPKPEVPPGTGPQDVEAQYKAAGLTTTPDVTNPEQLGPEEPAGPPVAPASAAPQGGFAANQPASTEVKGGEQLQNLANKAQYNKVAANLQPGEKIVQDTLGRFRRVRQ